MASGRTFAVVGAGQSGGWAAKTLRDEGFDGRILLIGDEDYPPHERPPLSKEVLLGDQPPDSTYLWPPDAWGEWRVEWRAGARVAALAPSERRILLADGEAIGYDRLLLAPGARPRTLPIPGADLAGVHYLRAIPDTEAIRAGLAPGTNVVVVGGGWIGLEVAAAARKLGAEVTVVEALDRVCGRALTAEFAAHVQAIHEDRGVRMRLGITVARFEGAGAVERAVLSDGTAVDAAMAVIGIGVVPNVELAAEAGLAADDGILVDEFGRTSDAHVFAAGDATNHPNPVLGRRVRLESWENAQNQAIFAARNMLDRGEAYAEIPWFWSDQYDTNIQLVGLPERWDRTVTRGDPTAGGFVQFYLRDGRIDGAAAIDQGRDIRFARRLMQANKPIDPDRLADPGVKLQTLLKG